MPGLDRSTHAGALVWDRAPGLRRPRPRACRARAGLGRGHRRGPAGGLRRWRPGGGKSRLLAEVATVLHERGAAVLLGGCIEEFGPPYQPFVQPLDALVPGPAQRPAAAGRAAAGQDPTALTDRLATLSGQRPARAAPREHRRRLYDAAVDAFRAAAAQRPLVLVLEDLHWAGSTALQLLGYSWSRRRTPGSCARHAPHHRRRTGPGRSRQAISPLYRLDGVRRLDLAGLDTEDIADYLVRESGVSASRAASCAPVLRDQTGGNPFFLRELWRDLAARGGPADLRCDRLPGAGVGAAHDREPAGSAGAAAPRGARAGRGHRRGLRLDHAGRLRPTGPTTRLWKRWTQAVDAGLVEPAAGPDGSFRFPHALARQAVLGLLAVVPTGARARTRGAGDRDPASPSRTVMSSSWPTTTRAPTTLGFADKAVRYLIRAAGVADRSLAHEDAARALEQAAALTEDADERRRLLLAASRSHLLGGDFARARELAERVAASDSARLRVRAAIAYEAAAWRPGHPGQRSVELLTSALAGIDREPADPDYVRAVASLGRALAFTGSTEEAHALGNRAVELAEATRRRQPARRQPAGEPVARAEPAGRAGQARARHPAVGPRTPHRATWASSARRPTTAAPSPTCRVTPAAWTTPTATWCAPTRATGQGFYGYMAGCMEYARHFLAGEFARRRALLHQPGGDGRVLRHRRHRRPLWRPDLHGPPRDRTPRRGTRAGHRRRAADRLLGPGAAGALHRAGDGCPGVAAARPGCSTTG